MDRCAVVPRDSVARSPDPPKLECSEMVKQVFLLAPSGSLGAEESLRLQVPPIHAELVTEAESKDPRPNRPSSHAGNHLE